MISIVEGKKRWILYQDCRGVSEVYGQLLMMSIVVIAFSTIGLSVFSDEGFVKPEHTPHTDLQENVNISTNEIQIVHSGGEDIERSAIKIILSVQKPGESEAKCLEFSGSKLDFRNPNGTESDSDDNIFSLGDCIIIDTTDPDEPNDPDEPYENVDIKSNHIINMFFVYIPSQQAIQRTQLQGGSGDPYWITPDPYGSVYDISGTGEEGFLPTELVGWINDGFLTESQIVAGEQYSEEFTFNIHDYKIDFKGPLKLVLLKIVYITHDDSQGMKLEINDGVPNEWVQIDPDPADPNDHDMEMHKDVNECDQDPDSTYNITDKVTTISELENLRVRVSAIGTANSENKVGWIDFVGIHAE